MMNITIIFIAVSGYVNILQGISRAAQITVHLYVNLILFAFVCTQYKLSVKLQVECNFATSILKV